MFVPLRAAGPDTLPKTEPIRSALLRHRVARRRKQRVGQALYAIVHSGGRQHKVAVGDVVEIDKITDQIGADVKLRPVLLVDGETVTSDSDALGRATVTAEVLAETKGPKIRIQKFKNKTGYKKRQGHRQRYTQVKVTGIDA